MKTKSAVLEKLGKPLILESLEIPSLGVGQVLVRIAYSGICGRQLGEISGAKRPDPYLPHLLGHEGGGVVLLTGPGVSTVKEGDHVCLHWRKGEGIEARPPVYKGRGSGIVGAGQIATFSELSVISENRMTKVSDDIGLEIIALMGCSVTTGLGLINNEAKLKIGQSIAVIGCGGVGINVIQGAALVGAYPIFAIDIKKNKLSMAIEFGATHPATPDCRLDGGFNVVVECTGIPSMIEKAYRMTGPGGKCIMVGQPNHEEALGIPFMSDHFTGKTLMDSQGGLTNPYTDIPRYIELYRHGKLKLDSMITHSFPLDDINKAIEKVKSGDCGKVMVEMR